METGMDIVRNIEVEMKEDLRNVPLSTFEVVVYSPFDDYVPTTVEVIEKDYLLKVYNAIDKDKLAKDLVAFAWDIKDTKVRHCITVELNVQDAKVDYSVFEFGVEFAYPALHQIMLHLAISEDTFSKYSTKEEAIADYKNLVMDYDDEFAEDLGELYEEIADELEDTLEREECMELIEHRPLLMNGFVGLEDKVVKVELSELDFNERCSYRVEVLERSCLEALIGSIDVHSLAKDIVEYAWDRKEITGSYIEVSLVPGSNPRIEVGFICDDFEYTYSELHISLMVLIIDEDTFAKYNNKEEAMNDYKNLVHLRNREKISDCLDVLYETIVDED